MFIFITVYFFLSLEKYSFCFVKVDLDSPMVVEEQKEQWRVPPIKDNHTVDIFTEPEYFQVYIVWTSYMICLLGCVLGVVGKQETAKSDCT